MKWSATMTTLAGSKTFAAPIFSIARKATGPETSFAITTSQRTITTSPGRGSSTPECAARIFSASVCGIQLLQMVEDGLERDHVPVLLVDVEEVSVVRSGVAVGDRLARDDRAIAVLEGVDHRRAHAPRGRGPRHDQAVAAVRREKAGERRPVERRGEELVQYRLVRERRDPRVDLDPAAARLERQQRRPLVDERGRC